MVTIIDLIHMDQDELIRNVHGRSVWSGDMLAGPESQDHQDIRDWITRSGWQSPSYNEFHSMAAMMKIADLEAIRKKHSSDSPEFTAGVSSLVSTLLARYGLTVNLS